MVKLHSGQGGPSARPYQFFIILGVGALVAKGVHQKLWVAVDANKGLHISMALDEIYNGPDFHFRIGAGSMVRVRAGVVTGPGSCQDRKAKQWNPNAREVWGRWIGQMPFSSRHVMRLVGVRETDRKNCKAIQQWAQVWILQPKLPMLPTLFISCLLGQTGEGYGRKFHW